MLNGKERGKELLCSVSQHGVVRNFLYRDWKKSRKTSQESPYLRLFVRDHCQKSPSFRNYILQFAFASGKVNSSQI